MPELERRLTTARLLVVLLAFAACAHMPKVQPGPPMRLTFAAPASDAQLFTTEVTRTSTVEFPDREPVEVKELVRTTQRETFEKQQDGGWLVSSELLDEEATRDGVPVGSAVPLKGVEFIAKVDAQGRFVRAEGLTGTIAAIEANAPTKAMRELIAPLLTPEIVARRIEEAWTRRTDGLCNATLTPGETFFSLEAVELPAGGPALALVKATVIGRTVVGVEPAAELWLEYGGASSKLARDPHAATALSKIAPGEVLTTDVEGHGRRYVSLATCQELAIESTVDGDWRLNKSIVDENARKSLPSRIRFHLERAGRTTSGPEAAVAEPMP